MLLEKNLVENFDFFFVPKMQPLHPTIKTYRAEHGSQRNACLYCETEFANWGLFSTKDNSDQ